MDALFYNQREINISLGAQACAALRAELEKLRFVSSGRPSASPRPGYSVNEFGGVPKKKRFAPANAPGQLPGRLCLRSGESPPTELRRYVDFLKQRSLFRSRAHWGELTCLRTLTVRRDDSPGAELTGDALELRLPPEEWQLFCSALGHFAEGYWFFHLDLPSCGLCVTFASHGWDADNDGRKLEDGPF